MSARLRQDPPITVRLGEERDLAALAARDGGADADSLDRHLALQEAGDYYFLVGLIADELAGYVSLDCRDQTDLRPEMKDMYVFPEYRRQGLGMALTQQLERFAAERGYDEINLGVNPDNPAAIPLYISLDYSATGNHRLAPAATDAQGRPRPREREAIYRKSLKIRRR